MNGIFLLSDICTRDPFDQFQYLLKEPRFEGLTSEALLNNDKRRQAFFDAFVSGRIERARLFADLLAVLQKNSFAPSAPPRSIVPTHVFPAASYDSTCAVLQLDNNLDEPRNWRSFFIQEGSDMNRLPVSGSAQFGLRGLRKVAQNIRALQPNSKLRMLCVDLRQEPHCFVEIATSAEQSSFYETSSHEVEATGEGLLAACWMTQHDFGAAGLSDAEAQQLENLFITMLRRQIDVKLGWPHNSKLPSQVYPLRSVMSEKELCKSEGFKYERLFITDHCRPRDGQVDEFVALMMKYMPKRNLWIHFHCHGGKGRTSTALCMVDILANAASHPKLTFDDFMSRQKEIGTYDLTAIPGGVNQFKQLYAIQRLEFLEMFYDYVREIDPLRVKSKNVGDGSVGGRKRKKNSWSKWLRKKLVDERDSRENEEGGSKK